MKALSDQPSAKGRIQELEERREESEIMNFEC